MDNLKQLKDGFDIRSYLGDIGAKCYEAGDKNVSDGWVGIECPFCGDDSSHLGIHYETGNYFTCWICGESGDVITLISELESLSFLEAKTRLKQFQGGTARPEKPIEAVTYDSILPKECEPILPGEEPPLVRQWFANRNFALSLCQRYHLAWVPLGSEYQLRLIVPVYLDRRLVSFQAVDLTGQARIPYLDCPEARAIIPNKHMLYGIDDVRDQVIIVEGVTDKWRVGRDAVAMFTKNWTIQQVELLKEKAKNKKIKIVLDMDAVRDFVRYDSDGRDLGFKLCELFPHVIFVELEEAKDPDKLSSEEIDKLVRY